VGSLGSGCRGLTVVLGRRQGRGNHSGDSTGTVRAGGVLMAMTGGN